MLPHSHYPVCGGILKPHLYVVFFPSLSGVLFIYANPCAVHWLGVSKLLLFFQITNKLFLQTKLWSFLSNNAISAWWRKQPTKRTMSHDRSWKSIETSVVYHTTFSYYLNSNTGSCKALWFLLNNHTL